jgi:hypothetical protein
MTQTPKQWATTGFIIGVASGIAAALLIFFIMRSQPAAAAQSQPAPAAAVVAAPAPPAHPAPSAQTQQSPPLIAGTIELEPSAKAKVALPAIVFVIARGEGLQSHGHPLLAKRVDVSAFPASFTLGSEDSMIGTPPPKRMSIEARIDRDGDATTREPGAPTATLDSVAVGTTDLKLVLKPKN